MLTNTPHTHSKALTANLAYVKASTKSLVFLITFMKSIHEIIFLLCVH